jgi:hypothetical protein
MDSGRWLPLQCLLSISSPEKGTGRLRTRFEEMTRHFQEQGDRTKRKEDGAPPSTPKQRNLTIWLQHQHADNAFGRESWIGAGHHRFGHAFPKSCTWCTVHLSRVSQQSERGASFQIFCTCSNFESAISRASLTILPQHMLCFCLCTKLQGAPVTQNHQKSCSILPACCKLAV